MGLEAELRSIEEMNLEVALRNCAGELEILKEVLEDLVADSVERINRARGQVDSKDYENYRIEAHSIKSNMALVGVLGISEHAKKHEMAARDGEFEYICSDYENLLGEYEDICRRLSEAIA